MLQYANWWESSCLRRVHWPLCITCITASDALASDACAPRSTSTRTSWRRRRSWRRNKTPGRVISELVRRGVLCTNMHSDQKPLPRLDRLVTNALVKQIQEEID